MENEKDSIYDKWLECYLECYNKSSYYDTKCGLCSFKKLCEFKYKENDKKLN